VTLAPSTKVTRLDRPAEPDRHPRGRRTAMTSTLDHSDDDSVTLMWWGVAGSKLTAR